MLGDEIAHSLGFAVHKERLLFFLSIADDLGIGLSGRDIGFIGLLILTWSDSS